MYVSVTQVCVNRKPKQIDSESLPLLILSRIVTHAMVPKALRKIANQDLGARKAIATGKTQRGV